MTKTKTKTIYADPELESEYTAGAWAAALQAHRRTNLLALIVVGLVLPLTIASYYFGRIDQANADEAGVEQAQVILVSFQEVSARLQEMDADRAVIAQKVDAVTATTVPTTVAARPTTTVRVTAQQAAPPVPVPVPAPVPVPTTTPVATTSTTPPPLVSACVLTICLRA